MEKVCLALRVQNLCSRVTFPVGSILLPLAEDRQMPVQESNLGKPSLGKQAVISTDFVPPLSKNIPIFLVYNHKKVH